MESLFGGVFKMGTLIALIFVALMTGCKPMGNVGIDGDSSLGSRQLPPPPSPVARTSPAPVPPPSKAPMPNPQPSLQPSSAPAPQPSPVVSTAPAPSPASGFPRGDANASGPAIFFTDILSGPTTGGPSNKGAPISIFGSGFGARASGSRVLIGGVEVSSYLVWAPAGTPGGALNPTLDMIVVQPPQGVSQGEIQVVVNGKTSNADHSFRANAGKILYLATNGSDSSPCSETQPCASLTGTLGKLNAGDIILLRGGTYTESEIWIRGEYGFSGVAGNNKVIKNYPGEKVIFSNASRPMILDADYFTISGFTFLNGKSTGISEKDTLSARHKGDRLINNSFEGVISWSAIDSHGDDHVIAGNNCQVSGSSVGTQGHCYYISHGDNIQILYNIGSGAPGYGLHIFDQRRQTPDYQRVMSRMLVEGNILTNSSLRSGLILACADESNLGNKVDTILIRNNILAGNNHLGLAIPPYCLVQNIKIYHNTFYENGRQAIALGGTSNVKNVEVKNNLFYQTENSVCTSNCSWYPTAHLWLEKPADNVQVQNNFYGGLAPTVIGVTDSASKTGGIQFRNPDGWDFRVQTGSANINQGLNLGDVGVDFFGIGRLFNGAPDLGAFEFLP